MKKSVSILVLTLLLLPGCASMPLVPPKMPDASNRAEVIVFRESAFNAGGVSVTFGSDEQAFVKLSNAEYASIFLAPGAYVFFVRARNGDPAVLTQTLKTGDRRCLKSVANPINLARAAVPILMMVNGYSFLLEEAPCLSNEELAKYARVNVEYQKP